MVVKNLSRIELLLMIQCTLRQVGVGSAVRTLKMKDCSFFAFLSLPYENDNQMDKNLTKRSTLNCCEYTSHRAMALTKADYTAIAEETNVSGDQTMER